MDIIKVIPIPNNTFTSNSITIIDPINDNKFDYNHVGTYNIKCSSYTDYYQPYNAFNKLSNKYWQSAYKGNSFYNQTCTITTYPNNPYTGNLFDNSAYQGGGPGTGTTAKWVTPVGISGQNKIYGEWIQIELPNINKLYLHDYSILTPIPTINNSTFPTKFMVVGSNDAQNWEYIDLQNIKKRINTKLQRPIVFNVNSTKSYSYYRLIIMEMPPKNSVVRINQWALNFLPYLSINTEAFTNYNYTNYNTSTPLDIENIDNSFDSIDNSDNKNYNDLLPLICTSILAISIIFYYKKNN